MANPSANLRVRISADLAEIRQGLGALRGELASVKKQAAAALPSLGNNAAVAGVRRLRAEVAGLAATYLSLSGAKVLTGMADEATLLRGRVKQAKGDYEAILAIAQETRSGLSATVDLYARVERSTRGQIKNQGELLTLTKAVNQAIQISGAGTQQAEAAILQLGQALGSGNLSGDELKSLGENANRIVEAIATGLGKSTFELKKLGAEGKLQTKVVIDALLSQSKVLAKESAAIPITVGGAMTQVRNAFLDFIGDQDEATGASRRFAEALSRLARELPRYLEPLLQAVTLLIKNLDVLAVYLGVRLAGAAIAAAVAGFAQLVTAIKAAQGAVITLRAAMIALGGPVGIVLAGLAAALYLVYKRTDEASVAAEQHSKALADNSRLAKLSAQAAYDEARAKRAQAIETLKAAQAILQERRARFAEANTSRTARGGDRGDAAAFASASALAKQQAKVDQLEKQKDDWTRQSIEIGLLIQQLEIAGTGAVASATGTASSGAEKAAKAVRGVVDQAALARDEVASLLRDLDDLYARNQVSIQQYFSQKAALQLRDIDLQIQQQQAEAKAATSSDQQSRALTEIVKLQRERAQIAPRAAREQQDAEEALAKAMGDVRIRLKELRGDTAGAARARLEGEFLELKQQLLANGKLDAVAEINLVINAEVAEAQVQQYAARMQQIMGRLQGTESSVSAQVDAGMLSPFEGERQLQALRQTSLAQLQELRAAALGYLSTMSIDSPEAQGVLNFITELDGNMANVTASTRKLAMQFAQVAIGAVSQLFMDLAEGSKSAGDALKDFVKGFIRGMAQIAAQALATYLVLQLLDAIYPGLGKATAAYMGVSYKHSGGIVGGGGRRGMVSPLLFGAAPRYHQGGIAGLAPNEVPTILERGEEVLTRDDPRHRYNGGGQGGAGGQVVVKQPILALGDRAFADALSSAAGVQEVIVGIVEQNWTRLNGAAR